MPRVSLCMYYTLAVSQQQTPPVLDLFYTGASVCSIHSLCFYLCSCTSANTATPSEHSQYMLQKHWSRFLPQVVLQSADLSFLRSRARRMHSNAWYLISHDQLHMLL